jgi:hypothetical protein
MSVPTPTGVLQGVAAFNWDGTVWQPTGRAGPSVATPTGNLQGVAAFTGGPSWAPAGRSGPGVPTPTGVLDGVAVYTWSGSQWTPPGGTETVPTPTGGLRGVAAFDWDGAAWQPAGQAGSSVPTPYGVLDGVARFGWTGSAWAATGAPSLSLDFMTPGALDPRITFTRASTATYTDAGGTIQTAAINAPRWDYDPVTHALRGLLIEDGRTNLLLNSAALGTQSVTVAAQAYALSFQGTGTITKSGAATGALVGAGATQRVSQTFTATAGTLTLTVTGSVLNAQLEAGVAGVSVYPTSWIPTTSAAVTRAQDSCRISPANMVSWFNASAGSWMAEFLMFNTTGGNARLIAAVAPGGGSITPLYANPSLQMGQYDGAAAVSVANAITANAVSKTASTWAAANGTACANGGAVASGAMSTGFASLTTPGIGFMTVSSPGSPDNGGGWLRRVSYWPRALSGIEMQAVTT